MLYHVKDWANIYFTVVVPPNLIPDDTILETRMKSAAEGLNWSSTGEGRPLKIKVSIPDDAWWDDNNLQECVAAGVAQKISEISRVVGGNEWELDKEEFVFQRIRDSHDAHESTITFGGKKLEVVVLKDHRQVIATFKIQGTQSRKIISQVLRWMSSSF